MEYGVKWLTNQITSSLRPRTDEISQMLSNEDNRLVFSEFFTNEDARRMFVYICPPRQIFASLNPPHDYRGKIVIFYKKNPGVKLTEKNIDDEVLYADCSENVLQHLGVLTREIYMPLLCSTDSDRVSSSASSRLLDVLHRIMTAAQTASGDQQGEIHLPMPSIEVLRSVTDPGEKSTVLHVLEGTVIGWSKLIEKLLKHNPLAELLEEYGDYPVPLDEVELWMMRRAKLTSVMRQMLSPLAVEILRTISELGSPYSSSIRSVIKEVNKTLEATDENLRYLKTASFLFEKLHVCNSAKELTQIFPPLIHVLHLIWTHSRYYHQRNTFHCLLFVVSNSVVRRATNLVGTDLMNRLPQAYDDVKEALRVCASFRGVYLDYREKANCVNSGNQQEIEQQKATRPLQSLKGSQSVYTTKLYGPLAYKGQIEIIEYDEMKSDSPWPVRNDKVFDPLNTFMERCNDVLEFIETVKHFRLLEGAADIGGAGNHTLDVLVREIHEKFVTAYDVFRATVPDVFDLDPSAPFMRAFFAFRTLIKGLEQKLADIMRLGLLQCSTVTDRLRLLQVFDGISSRHAIRTILKDELETLTELFAAEILDVQNVFQDQRSSPPVHRNVPSIVGSLLWAYALRQRIEIPMKQFATVCPHLLEGDKGYELRVTYNETVAALDGFGSEILIKWQQEIKENIIDKLDQPLLTLASTGDGDDRFTDVSSVNNLDIRRLKFAVNLDDHLLRLIREMYYLCRSPLQEYVLMSEVVTSARDQLQGVDVAKLRLMATQLETIVSMFNMVMSDTSLFASYEQALFEQTLQKISQLFLLGLTECTWRTVESADFIELASALVCGELHHNLDIVQTNRRTIQDIANNWHIVPLDVCSARNKARSYSLVELDTMHRKLNEDFKQMLIPAGHQIHKLVHQSFQAVDLSEASPVWMDYVAVLDDIVLTGLHMATMSSLGSIFEEITAKHQHIQPLLAVRLELLNNEVTTSPALDRSTTAVSLQETVEDWLNDILNRGQCIETLSSKGSYQDFVKTRDDVQYCASTIMSVVGSAAAHCTSCLQKFASYSFLWKQHLQIEFVKFLNGEEDERGNESAILAESEKYEYESSPMSVSTRNSQSASQRLKHEKEFMSFQTPSGVVACVPILDNFDSKIASYKVLQDQIHLLDISHSEQSMAWISLDLQPIKHILSAYAGLWIWTHTKYVADQVEQVLHKIDEFLSNIEPCIESITGDERDLTTFMRLMRIFNEVSVAQQQFEGKFPVIQRAVQMLNRYEHRLSDATRNQLSAMPVRWNALKTRVSLAKQQLGPKIQEESDQITKDLRTFVGEVESFMDDLSSSDLYLRSCTVESAFALIERFAQRLLVLEYEAEDLLQLQELLEISIIECTLLPRSAHNLNILRLAWQTVSSVRAEQSSWMAQRWIKLNSEQLTNGTTRHLAAIETLPLEVLAWDVIVGLNESTLAIQAYISLINDLSSTAMRPRHWKSLARVVGNAIIIDGDSLKSVSFGELLKLRLEKHTSDVRQIVHQAVAELSIEQHLKTYEEVWLSKVFELREHVMANRDISQDKVEHNDGGIASQDNASESLSHASQTRGRPGSRLSGQTSSGLRRMSKISLISLPQWLTDITDKPGPIHVVANAQSILDELEAHQMALHTMGDDGDGVIGSFIDDISQWQATLQKIENVVRLWLEVQNRWLELEEMYSSVELLSSCPADCERYAHASHDFRRMMKATEQNNNVLQCCQREGILHILERINTSFEISWKSLLETLETRRQRFPRFYFLSSTDLLRVLCNGYDLSRTNRYIGKLFENIRELIYIRESEKGVANHGHFQITGVRSCLGEELPLSQSIICESRVENWLLKLLTVLRTSLKEQLVLEIQRHEEELDSGRVKSGANDNGEHDGAEDSNALKNSDISSGSSQRQVSKRVVAEMIYLATQIRFSTEFLSAKTDFTNGNKGAFETSLIRVKEKLQEQSNVINRSWTSKTLTNSASTHLPSELHILSSLVSLYIHQRDVLENIQSKVVAGGADVNDILVQSQLHFVWNAGSEDVDIQCMGTRFQYGFEYLGSADREPLTSATDQSFFHLTQALYSQRAAICYDASSSKCSFNEVQQFCRCLGRAMFSFHCVESSNWAALSNVMKGLATTGVVVCITDVNRLRNHVTSMANELLGQIMNAFVTVSSSISLLGEKLRVDSSGFYIATLSSDYIALTDSKSCQLPRHLAAQYRTVGVRQPPLRLVAEMILLSEGFLDASNLGRKVATLFETCENIFCQSCRTSTRSQHHLTGYWNAATVKSVVRQARLLSTELIGDEKDMLSENEAVVCALQVTLLPQLDSFLLSQYRQFIKDIWNNQDIVQTADEKYSSLSGRQISSLQGSPFLRSDESESTSNVTPPLISLTNSNNARQQSFPPKEFEGCDDESSLTKNISLAARELGYFTTESFHLRIYHLAQMMKCFRSIVVVGPPSCGKTACIRTLMNSERKMGSRIDSKSIFIGAYSAEELMGMYCSQKKLWKDGVLSSVLRDACHQMTEINDENNEDGKRKFILHLDGSCTQDRCEMLEPILSSNRMSVLQNNEHLAIPESLKFIVETDSLANVSPSSVCTVGLIHVTNNDCWQSILASWLNRHPSSRQLQLQLQSLCERYVAPSISYINDDYNGLGTSTRATMKLKRLVSQTNENIIGTLTALVEASLKELDESEETALENQFAFCCLWAFGSALESASREVFSDWWKVKFNLYADCSPDTTVFDYVPQGKQLVLWSTIAASRVADHSFVRTARSEQLLYLMRLVSNVAHRPVVLVGEPGCGKTALAQEYARSVVCELGGSDLDSVLTVHADRLTTAKTLYQKLNEKVCWSHGNTYHPAASRRFVCVLDDLNLAKVDEHHIEQPAVELLRQHVTEGGFYDPDDYKWREFLSIDYIAVASTETTPGSNEVSPRLMQHCAVFACLLPGNEELQRVFSTMLNQHFCTPDLAAVLSAMNQSVSTTSLAARINSAATKEHLDEKRALLEHQVKVQNSLRSVLSLVVRVTLEIHVKVRGMFLPTAARCHYLFTMKNLARIFRNLTVSLDEHCTHDGLLLLWKHECHWTYSRQMVSEVDTRRYAQAFARSIKKNFTNSEQIQLLLNKEDPIFSSVVEQNNGMVSVANCTNSIGSSGRDAPMTDGYRPVSDIDRLGSLLSRAVQEHNKVEPVLQMALYRSTMEQVCRLARMIASPHCETSHSYLVAEGCPGRANSIATLAAYIAGFEPFKLRCASVSSADSSGNDYIENFRADFMRLCLRAGVKGKRLLFLVQEEEMMNDDVLIILAEFIQSGFVWNLFSSEQQIAIINSIRSEVTQAGLVYSKDVAWKFFQRCAKKNIRICFIASDAEVKFRQHCSRYSGFVRNVNVIWLPHWSKQQLVSHALYQLKGLSWMNRLEAENVAHLLATMHLAVIRHDNVRHRSLRHLTNYSYEKFVERFVSLAGNRHAEIHSTHSEMQVMCSALEAKEELAEKMMKHLTHEKVILEERKTGTLNMLTQIGQDTAIAEQQMKIVNAQMEKISQLRARLPEYQVAHERAVYKTVAVVADTKKVIQNISLEGLSQLRSMQKPQNEVEELLAAIIVILKGEQADLTWAKGAKRQMANLERFIEKLVSFDEHGPPHESTLDFLESTYIKKASFDPDHLLRITENVACASLCRWVKGVHRFHRLMLSRVKPIHALVEKTIHDLETAEQKMKLRDSKRLALRARLLDLGRAFEEATVDKMDQLEKTTQMQKSLDMMTQFRQALFQEKIRMHSVINSITLRELNISGSSAMAAAFVTYLGPYDVTFRRMMMTDHWPRCLVERGIPLAFDAVHPVYGHVTDYSMKLQFFRALPDASVENIYSDSSSNTLEMRDGNGLYTAESTDHLTDVMEDENEDCTEGDREEDQYDDDDDDGRSMYSNLTADNVEAAVPQIDSAEYILYIKSILKLLVGELCILEWVDKEYPLQKMENSAILLESWQRALFVLDPHGQGLDTIKSAAVGLQSPFSKLMILDMSKRSTDNEFIVDVERCIMGGFTLLVHNCNQAVDPLLLPLIDFSGSFDESSRRAIEPRQLKFNGRRLLCHPSFRIILSMKNASLSTMSPLISSVTTVIDFSISDSTLTELLIRRAVAHIQPLLLDHRRTLTSFVRRSSKSLGSKSVEFQAKLRHMSRTIDKDSLDEESVIAIMRAAEDAVQIARHTMEAQEALSALNVAEYQLFPLARRAAMLFATTRGLVGFCSQVGFSIVFLTKLFDQAFDTSLPDGYKDILDNGSDSAYYSSAIATDKGLNDTAETNESDDGVRGSGDDVHLLEFSEDALDELYSAEVIEKLKKRLTTLFIQRIKLSLLSEHQHIFTTQLCLNICEENRECTDSELLWLLRDDRGSLIRKKYNSLSSRVLSCPSWLPSDCWLNLVAAAVVTRSARLVRVCDEVAENVGDYWQQWYCTEHPELESLPSDSAVECLVENAGSTSSLPTVSWLILVLALRPDRFSHATVKFTDSCSSKFVIDDADCLTTHDMDSVMSDARAVYDGFLVIHKSDQQTPQAASVILQLAKAKGVDIKTLSLADNVEVDIGKWLEASFIDQNNGWMAIDCAHLMSCKQLRDLTGFMQRAARNRVGGNVSLLWIIADSTIDFPLSVLQYFYPLTLDGIHSVLSATPPAVSFHKSLSNVITSCFDLVPPDLWAKAADVGDSDKRVVLGTSIATCVVAARRMLHSEGPSSQDCATVLPTLIDMLVNSRSSQSSEQICNISKAALNNCLWNLNDRKYASDIMDLVTSMLQQQGNTLTIGSAVIELPPTNLGVDEYGEWLYNQLQDLPVSAFFSDTSIDREMNIAAGGDFLNILERVYSLQTNSCRQVNSQMSHLRSVLDLVSRDLPSPLTPSNVVDGHTSRLMSSSSFGSNLRGTNDAVSFALLQECKCMNALLESIQKDLVILKAHLLGTWASIPRPLQPVACALSREIVPAPWSGHQSESGHQTISTWLKDLKKRYRQMCSWLEGGTLRLQRAQVFNKSMFSVWLGGLFNPQTFLTATRHQMASQLDCSIDEVELECYAVANADHNDGIVQGEFFITDVVLENGEWVHETGCLTYSKCFKNPVAKLAVRASLKSEKGERVTFCCPIYTSSTHRVCIGHVQMPCSTTFNASILSGTAIVLMRDTTTHRKELTTVRRKLPKPYFGDDAFEENQFTRAELGKQKLEMAKDQATGEFMDDRVGLQPEQPSSQRDLEGSIPSTRSQLSYRPSSPNAPPLPPNLRLARESHLAPPSSDVVQAAGDDSSQNPLVVERTQSPLSTSAGQNSGERNSKKADEDVDQDNDGNSGGNSQRSEPALLDEHSRRVLNSDKVIAEGNTSSVDAKPDEDDEKDSESADDDGDYDDTEPFDDDDVINSDVEQDGNDRRQVKNIESEERVERGTMSQTTDSEDNVKLF